MAVFLTLDMITRDKLAIQVVKLPVARQLGKMISKHKVAND